ncbi:MAG: hypothetical protein HY898_22180 [Deltaproteobacteria bacterium]|nr:hypothetical protein [Deltaproteobacteria bacterium]
MASKFSEFLTTKKIDPRRVLIASQKIEGLQPADRTLRLTERKARKSEDPPAKKEGEKRVKPRSGRPVTERSLNAALAGQTLTGPQKTRILRAINRILEQRKQDPTDLRALF